MKAKIFLGLVILSINIPISTKIGKSPICSFEEVPAILDGSRSVSWAESASFGKTFPNHKFAMFAFHYRGE